MFIGEIYRVLGTDCVVIGGAETLGVAIIAPLDKLNDVEKYFRPIATRVLTMGIGKIDTLEAKKLGDKVKALF